jgi:hypothetical protein
LQKCRPENKKKEQADSNKLEDEKAFASRVYQEGGEQEADNASKIDRDGGSQKLRSIAGRFYWLKNKTAA